MRLARRFFPTRSPASQKKSPTRFSDRVEVLLEAYAVFKATISEEPKRYTQKAAKERKNNTLLELRGMRPSVDFKQLLNAHFGVDLRRLQFLVTE